MTGQCLRTRRAIPGDRARFCTCVEGKSSCGPLSVWFKIGISLIDALPPRSRNLLTVMERVDCTKGPGAKGNELTNLGVILIGGTSHTGKSTVAKRIAERLGAICVSTDSLARHPGRPWPAAREVPPHVVEHYLQLGD